LAGQANPHGNDDFQHICLPWRTFSGFRSESQHRDIYKEAFEMRKTLLLIALLLMLCVSAFAQVTAVPQRMNFQGRLTRPDGTPVPDGTYSVRFSLWDAATSGTEKWNQTVNSITVRNGTFAVLLDTSTGATDKFNGNLYLEIKIGSDAPLAPRQPLVSVANAMKTDSIKDGGVLTNSLADNAVTTLKIANDAVSSAKLLSDAASLSKVSGGIRNITSSRLFYPNGVIQNGGSALTGTTDLGLYSQTPNNWMRFVTNNGNFQWFTDSGIGTNPRMTLGPDGRLDVFSTSISTIVGNSSNTAGTWLRLNNSSTGAHNWAILASGGGNSEGPGKLIFTDQTAGATRMVLDTNGYLGIGVTSPGAPLEVRGGTGPTSLRVTPGNLFGIGTANAVTLDISNAGTLGIADAVSLRGDLARTNSSGGTRLLLGYNGAQDTGYLQMLGPGDKLLAGLGGDTNGGNIYTKNASGTTTIYLDGTNGEMSAKVVTVTGGSDVAEPYHVAPHGDIEPLPGMVVCIDSAKVGQMKVAGKAYDKTVAGILSGANGIRPGLTLTQKGTIADGDLPVASIGRVWCWCDADANGPIEAGDMLTTSDTPGHAMKVSDFTRGNGAVIGKAMSSLKSGKGLVLVLVSLK
jgi:hypothetical protein